MILIKVKGQPESDTGQPLQSLLFFFKNTSRSSSRRLVAEKWEWSATWPQRPWRCSTSPPRRSPSSSCSGVQPWRSYHQRWTGACGQRGGEAWGGGGGHHHRAGTQVTQVAQGGAGQDDIEDPQRVPAGHGAGREDPRVGRRGGRAHPLLPLLRLTEPVQQYHRGGEDVKQNSVTTISTGSLPNHREQEQRQTGGGCAGFCLHQVPRQDQVSHFFPTGFALFFKVDFRWLRPLDQLEWGSSSPWQECSRGCEGQDSRI